MKKMNAMEMRNVKGGWYFGNVYCPICGRKGKPTLVQQIAYGKSTLQGFMVAAHGLNGAYGTKIRH